MPDDSPKTPGQTVKLAMEEKGWGQTDLAFALGTTTASVNLILNDKRGISHNMARALAVALDKPATFFAKAQAEWDVKQAGDPDPAVESRARILARYPLREMIKRGWIDPEHGEGTVEEQVCRFFAVKSLDDVPHLSHAAKKSGYESIPPSQLAWLFRAKKIASEMVVDAFNVDKLNEVVSTFSEMRDEPGAVRRVPKLLASAGVRFVVVEGLPGASIDGVCFWLSKSEPVIGMSLRFDRIDNFWFVLRHECAHVLHGHGKTLAIIDEDVGMAEQQNVDEEERIANAEAANFCVPLEQMKSFYLRKNPFFSDSDVRAFASRMKVHPGIAVGQLHQMSKRYDLLRKYLVKIRVHLKDSMMMDGWGDVIPVDR